MPLARIDALLETSEIARDWGTSLQHVTSGNPLLLRAYAEAQRARVGIERAEVQPIPNVELQASVMHMAQSDNVGANVQVGLPLPIFNKNQGNIDRAWCEYHRAQWNAERLRLSLEKQLAAAFGDYRDAANRVATYRDEIVPRQQQSLELIELGYPAQFDFLRLFTARRTYYDARVQYLNALVDLRQAEALIDGLLLTGGFNELDDTVIDDGLRGAALSGQ
jgi:cobalt-zinc-cadmium efflux system outer membrane protein